MLYTLNFDLESEKRLQTFVCYGLDPVHRGSLKIQTGAIVGIPHTFAYSQPDHVRKELFQIFDQDQCQVIDWDSEAGKSFLDSMVLSENAKMFGIARTLRYASTHAPYADATLRAGFGFLAFAGCVSLHRTVLSKLRGFSLRALCYSAVSGLCWLFYIATSDSYHCWVDGRVDYAAAKLSTELAEGAVEFYAKTAQRNIALRKLLGKQGEETFTAYGNEVSKLRRPHQEVTTRLVHAKKILDSIKESPPSEVSFDPDADKEEKVMRKLFWFQAYSCINYGDKFLFIGIKWIFFFSLWMSNE